MTIKWDSRAADEVIRQMRSSEDDLNECLFLAQQAREALREATPESSDTMTRLTDQFESAVRSIRANQQAIEALIDSANAVKREFDEADETISKKVTNLTVSAGGAGLTGTVTANAAALWTTGPRPNITLNYVPAPFIMPPPARPRVFVPGWLLTMLTDNQVFDNITSRS